MVKDKVILILGGTGGIGSAIADLLEKEEARVCRHGISGEYAADVRDTEQTERMLKKVLEKFGRIDVVINSISVPASHGGIEKKNWIDFKNHFDVQLKAAVETSHFLVPFMKKQGGGNIVNILTSYVVGVPPSGLSDYVTAKYAMLGLTKALARELARYHISVSAVSPSIIKNNFTANVPEKLLEIEAQQSPTGRLTRAEDVAKAVLSLMTDADSSVNGQNIIISGGQITNQNV